jgi:hypothetical protein
MRTDELLAENNKLLAKLLFEMRDLRADLRRRAGEPEPVKPDPRSQFSVSSVRTSPGQRPIVTGGDRDSSLTPEQRAQLAAQTADDGRLRPPVDRSHAVMLTEAQLREFRGGR